MENLTIKRVRQIKPIKLDCYSIYFIERLLPSIKEITLIRNDIKSLKQVKKALSKISFKVCDGTEFDDSIAMLKSKITKLSNETAIKLDSMDISIFSSFELDYIYQVMFDKY